MCVWHVLCMCMYVDTGGQIGYCSSGIPPFSFLFIGRGIHQPGAHQLGEAGWLARKRQGSVNLQGLVLGLQVYTVLKMWVLGIRVAAGTDSLTMILAYLQICLCLEEPKNSERCCAEEKRMFESELWFCTLPAPMFRRHWLEAVQLCASPKGRTGSISWPALEFETPQSVGA